MLYIQVRDLSSALNKAVQLGGAITTEPFDIPDGPTPVDLTIASFEHPFLAEFPISSVHDQP